MAGQVSKLRTEAKKMATDRHARKEKHRLMRRWVNNQYNKNNATAADDKVDLGDSDSESASDKTMDQAAELQSKIWNQLAYQNNAALQPKGVTLDSMLRIAKACYEFASHDFDTMSLFDHVSYIYNVILDPDAKEELFVSKHMVVLAQQQLECAKNNFTACVARIATTSNMPTTLRPHIKTCQNCYSKFKAGATPCSCKKAKKTCFHGPCRYHPGNIRCWNDKVRYDGRELGACFLDNGQVKLSEFKFWIHQCYWDCCGAKLVEVGPDAGKRSQKRKDEPLKPWEEASENDGSVGCTMRWYHIAIQ
ncbi:hypothetical protein F5Y04DRAFT_285498 [Hypomontagnella monticulosa]|nr:hypothetical protein F5Y04DRAFT_285498 [Hypomontagnella monticulosa]